MASETSDPEVGLMKLTMLGTEGNSQEIYKLLIRADLPLGNNNLVLHPQNWDPTTKKLECNFSYDGDEPANNNTLTSCLLPVYYNQNIWVEGIEDVVVKGPKLSNGEQYKKTGKISAAKTGTLFEKRTGVDDDVAVHELRFLVLTSESDSSKNWLVIASKMDEYSPIMYLQPDPINPNWLEATSPGATLAGGGTQNHSMSSIGTFALGDDTSAVTNVFFTNSGAVSPVSNPGSGTI